MREHCECVCACVPARVCIYTCLHACMCVCVYIPCTLVVKHMRLQLATRKHVLNSKCALNNERMRVCAIHELNLEV